MATIPEYLTSNHPDDICRNSNCLEAVKWNPATGRYFITMGHAGFNSPANNAHGYATQRTARAAIRFYLRRGHEGHDVEMVQGYVGPDDSPDAGRPYPFCHTCNEDLSHLGNWNYHGGR